MKRSLSINSNIFFKSQGSVGTLFRWSRIYLWQIYSGYLAACCI